MSSLTATTVMPTVVICTRDRPDDAAAAIRAILASDPPVAELIVVDQSEAQATRDAVTAVVSATRSVTPVRVVRDMRRGLAAARNAGMRASTGEVVAFTDDDCRADPRWASAFRDLFAGNERLAIAFGNVVAAGYDHSRGFIPSYRVRRAVVADRLAQKCRIEGMGACMAVRCSAWRELGGFDEALGCGVSLPAGEETDLVVRSLAAGWLVAETPDAVVAHDGFRTWEEGRDLIRGYMLGLGATYAKMTRLGGIDAIRPLVELAWRWLAGTPLVDLNQRPPRLARLTAFLRGAWEGLSIPLDASGRFVPRRATAPSPAADVAPRGGEL